ncbi:FAD dependent oxidoreductase [Cynara cardunculus var. scolymus]|uniref:FAD dependent oxidoreductase n=1 Tax=Cynara cardunculus var. scolymus TaxID=59895 RepID=A0A103Y668_CYNCS|nr:FAD dependent oxidoreductase [Cynara cardunculus var. scolymus]
MITFAFKKICYEESVKRCYLISTYCRHDDSDSDSSSISVIDIFGEINYCPSVQMTTVAARDFAVIGAGAAGLAAALHLRREGHSVVVFERESLG